MSLAVLTRKSKTLHKPISSNGVFTLNGTTGTRRPLWCGNTGQHNVAPIQPVKSVNSASIHARCACDIHKDIIIDKNLDPNRGGPDCGVLVAGPGSASQGEYLKNKACCRPLINLNANKINAICERDETGKKLCPKSRGQIYKDLRGALSNSDYINWVGGRVRKPQCKDGISFGKNKSLCVIMDNSNNIWPDKNQRFCC